MIIELHRHGDDVIALFLQQRRDDGGIDPARHGDDDAGFGRRLGEAKGVQTRRIQQGRFQKWRAFAQGAAGGSLARSRISGFIAGFTAVAAHSISSLAGSNARTTLRWTGPRHCSTLFHIASWPPGAMSQSAVAIPTL